MGNIKNKYIITAKKEKQIDVDNFRLIVKVSFPEKNYSNDFETIMQYNIRTNTVNHNDDKFESVMDLINIDVYQIIDDIEKRKIPIES